jgi:hypothetical protein
MIKWRGRRLSWIIWMTQNYSKKVKYIRFSLEVQKQILYMKTMKLPVLNKQLRTLIFFITWVRNSTKIERKQGKNGRRRKKVQTARHLVPKQDSNEILWWVWRYMRERTTSCSLSSLMFLFLNWWSLQTTQPEWNAESSLLKRNVMNSKSKFRSKSSWISSHASKNIWGHSFETL